MKKEIQNFEELESFLKKHNYAYPKTWKNKLKKIKRKDRTSSTWKDFRMCMYAYERILRCSTAIIEDMTSTAEKFDKKLEKIGSEKYHKLLSENSLTVADMIKILKEIIFLDKEKYFQKVLKKGGKSYFQRNLSSKAIKAEKMLGVKIPKTIKLPKKKDTIFQIIETDYYWTERYIYFGKQIEDRDNKNIFRKEAQEYFKSVCTYINQPKYTKDFFISHSEKELHKYIESYWELFLKVR